MCAQWTHNANTTGAPKWGIYSFRSRAARGSGQTQAAANNVKLVANSTADSFTRGEVNGMFPVTPGAKANTSGESRKAQALGWALRTAGEGPVLTFNAANGSRFANGETAVLSNGNGSNATLTITSNATTNLASVAIQGGPGPTYAVNTAAVVTFTREQHVSNLNFSNSTALTNVGNANTINVNIGNTGLSYGVNAFASFLSNSTGGFTNTNTQAIAWAANSTVNFGLFANNQTNTAVVITFTNANGAVVGGTYVATANLLASTGGTITAKGLGGRAGRVTYETLVVDRHINATATSSVTNSAGILPE